MVTSFIGKLAEKAPDDVPRIPDRTTQAHGVNHPRGIRVAQATVTLNESIVEEAA